MDLFIIRHAAAEERDAAQWPDDSKRPLTETGRKKFRRVAQWLGEVVDDPPLVLSSRWVRAWETAKILADEGDWPAPKAFSPLELETNQRVITSLREHSKEKAIALVGHEPQLGELISLLLTGDEQGMRIDLKKGAAVCLTLPAALAPGKAVLNWIITPRLVNS
jgi:phosphohistidine phosphatase